MLEKDSSNCSRTISTEKIAHEDFLKMEYTILEQALRDIVCLYTGDIEKDRITYYQSENYKKMTLANQLVVKLSLNILTDYMVKHMYMLYIRSDETLLEPVFCELCRH